MMVEGNWYGMARAISKWQAEVTKLAHEDPTEYARLVSESRQEAWFDDGIEALTEGYEHQRRLFAKPSNEPAEDMLRALSAT